MTVKSRATLSTSVPASISYVIMNCMQNVVKLSIYRLTRVTAETALGIHFSMVGARCMLIDYYFN